MIIDTHCHINYKDFDEDRDEVIKRASEKSVSTLIAIGTDLKTSQDAIALAKQYPNIYDLH